MYGWDILCEISKGAFEIPDKISYPNREWYNFHIKLKVLKLLDLRTHKFIWNVPPGVILQKSKQIESLGSQLIVH